MWTRSEQRPGRATTINKATGKIHDKKFKKIGYKNSTNINKTSGKTFVKILDNDQDN